MRAGRGRRARTHTKHHERSNGAAMILHYAGPLQQFTRLPPEPLHSLCPSHACLMTVKAGSGSQLEAYLAAQLATGQHHLQPHHSSNPWRGTSTYLLAQGPQQACGPKQRL
jgi:hypothetical protein